MSLAESDPSLGAETNWAPAGATDYQSAFEIGEEYASGVIEIIQKRDELAPNFLWSIVDNQRAHWPENWRAIENGYIAGFWCAIQRALRQ